METDPARTALPHIGRLHAYTPGLQPEGPGWVKLNTNECPYPPSPRVAEAIRRELGTDGAALRLYPDPRSSRLRAAVARSHGVGDDQVITGNGSDDLLNLLVRCWVSPAAAAGFTWPSYSLYPVLVGIQDGRCELVEFEPDLKLPVERIIQSNASLFFLTSPNAPTGVGFSAAELERILRGFPGLLVVDEAYAAFADENALGLLARYPRLVVVRTLSKALALAGIRVGYALAHPSVIDRLDRVRDSYNVNRLSQVAALAAVEDPEYAAEIVRRVKATRGRHESRLRTERGWFTYPSQANFIFTQPRDSQGNTGPGVAAAAYEFLRSRRVLVRHFPSHALTAPFLRITVGTDDEMNALQEGIDAWLKAPQNA